MFLFEYGRQLYETILKHLGLGTVAMNSDFRIDISAQCYMKSYKGDFECISVRISL